MQVLSRDSLRVDPPPLEWSDLSFVDIYRRAASYADRILRGTKPAELPVQVPVKFEMMVNAKTRQSAGADRARSLRGDASRTQGKCV